MTDSIFNEFKHTDLTIRLLHTPNEFEQKAAYLSLREVRLPALMLLGLPLVKTLNKYSYVFLNEKDQSHEAEAVARMREPNPKKKVWLEFMTLFFTPLNFHYVLAAMPDNMRRLWLAVGNKHFVNVDEAQKLYGKKCTDNRAWRTHLIDELCDFFRTCGANDWYYFDSTDSEEYLKFSNIHFYSITMEAQRSTNPFLDSLPKGITPVSVENNLFTDLPIIESLNLAQKLPLGTNKLRTAQFNKSVRAISIKEFFESNTKFEESLHLRADFLALSYQMMHHAGVLKNKTTTQDIAQAWAASFHRFGDYFFSLYFPHLKGIKKTHIGSSTDEILSYIYDFCSHINANQWIDVNYICYIIRSLEAGYDYGELDFLLFNEQDCAARLDVTNKLTGDQITPDKCIEQISVPAIKAILFSLASWGILEIACEPQKGKEQFSPYDALRYIRLTPLGRYAFKIDKDYTPQVKIEQTTDFELNESRLIIKLLDPDSPRNVAIDQFAQAVTPMLYSVSPEYFLRDCLSLKDLEGKISRFQQIVRTEMPDNWKAFFDELRSQCDPFKKPKDAYSIYRIDPKDKKLQAIILNDPMLKQYILRAENYMVLIERAFIPDVKRILLKYGYIF